MTLTAEQQAVEVACIRDEDKWPLWPMLPVKIPGKAFDGGLGFIVATGPNGLDKPTVYQHDLGMMGPVPRDAEHGWTITEYESVEAMVAAGWVGD